MSASSLLLNEGFQQLQALLSCPLSSCPPSIAKLHPQSFVTSSLKDNNRGNWNFHPHRLPGFVMNLSAACEIRVTVCAADRLGQRFIPPSWLKMAPSLPPSLPNNNLGDKRRSDWCCGERLLTSFTARGAPT